MSTEGTGLAPKRPAGRGRAFRPGWSLAAGWCAAPRLGPIVVFVVAWVAVAADSPHLQFPRHPAVRALCLSIVAYVAWFWGSALARGLRRRFGGRQPRGSGEADSLRDREWPAKGVGRRIAAGMQGMSVPVTLAVAGTAALSQAVLGVAPGFHRRMMPENLGWAPAAPVVVVATYVLPLAWLLVAFAPRLGRGRLVVSWPTFPQFTGGRCSFHVGTSPGGVRIDGVRVFLRCIRVRNRPFLPFATWNSRLAWVAEARIGLSPYLGPESHLRAEFDVPAEAPSTDLHAADAVRWELLIRGTVGATDYADCVDVPVYAATA